VFSKKAVELTTCSLPFFVKGLQARHSSGPQLTFTFGEEKRHMKTQVEFRSDKFPPYDGEQEEINPGLWDKRLAGYLQNNLTHYGVKVTGIGSENCGWMVNRMWSSAG
jgi:hypothetical protein